MAHLDVGGSAAVSCGNLHAGLRGSLPSRRAERKGGYKSNMESLIGREATVIEMIPAEDVGRVKIDGDEWQAVLAREDDNEPRRDIQVGEKVIIVSYDSIILTVKTKKSETPTA